jgi:hypothetical protein
MTHTDMLQGIMTHPVFQSTLDSSKFHVSLSGKFYGGLIFNSDMFKIAASAEFHCHSF